MATSFDPRKVNPDDPKEVQQMIGYVEQMQEEVQRLEAKVIALSKENESLENRYLRQAELIQNMPTSSSQELAPVLSRLSSQIGVQNVTEIVKPFSGHPRELVNWLKSCENFACMIAGSPALSEQEVIQVVYRTSRQTVSDFLGRHLEQNPTTSWAVVKVKLTERFGERINKMTKFEQLRKYR